MNAHPSHLVLAGDIGGTKTDLAVLSEARGPRDPIARAEFHSSDYASLEDIVREFRKGQDLPVAAACFDIAGPVIQGRVKTTNLPWDVDEAVLGSALDIAAVRIINDLEATALAVPLLQDDELHVISEGHAIEHGNIAVIAPGTGLGEAFLTWDAPGGYRAHASEGGHADFAPADEQQIGLLRYVGKEGAHVSWERVCSGIGIPNLYAYLRDVAGVVEVPPVAVALAAAADSTRFILETAVDSPESSPLCDATLRLFTAILGAESGNLALKTMATGGVYLAGGIPMHILPALDAGAFAAAFCRKGRMSDLMAQVPVKVIKAQAALIGAATFALRMLGHVGSA